MRKNNFKSITENKNIKNRYEDEIIDNEDIIEVEEDEDILDEYENDKSSDDKYEKTFDEIMDEILSKNDVDNVKSEKDEFEEEVARLKEEIIDNGDFTNFIYEDNDSLEYNFTDDARISLNNVANNDETVDLKHYHNIKINTANKLYISGRFNADELVINKFIGNNKLGLISFADEQKVTLLNICNVGVVGTFDSSKVLIDDSSYVDITLDITDKTKITTLLIDTRFNMVRGKINMTRSFYDQLTKRNENFLKLIARDCEEKGIDLKLLVDGEPFLEVDPAFGLSDNINQEYYDIRSTLEIPFFL